MFTMHTFVTVPSPAGRTAPVPAFYREFQEWMRKMFAAPAAAAA